MRLTGDRALTKMRAMRARVVAGLRTRPAAFALAVTALLLIAAGVAADGWMLTIPSYVPAPCTQSSNIVTITSDGTYCEGPNPAIQPWLGLVLAALGVGLLVMDWTVDRRPFERPRQGWKSLRAWGAPLLWLALVPIIAAPVGYLVLGWEVRKPTCQIAYGFLFGSSSECPVSALVPSVLIPGLLNLVPFRWLWIADPRTRIAAISASTLGVAGLVGSLWELFAQGPTFEVDSDFIVPSLPPPGPSGLALGTVIWLLTLIALLVIAKLPVGRAASRLLTPSPAG